MNTATGDNGKNISSHIRKLVEKQVIKTTDILYVESSGHKNIICLNNLSIEQYGKISDLERELTPDFFRIHRGYLINLRHVEHYDRTNVYMDNGDRLCLSRYRYKEFAEAYLRYISEGANKQEKNFKMRGKKV